MDNISDDDAESEVDWQVVPNRKRNMSRSNSSEPKSKSAKKDQPSTSNMFDGLDNELDNDDNSNISGSNTLSTHKPPPIYIPDVNNVSSMVNKFANVISQTEFTYKALRGNQVKVSTKSVKAYRILVEYCMKKSLKFHTYQLKAERAFRVVVRNLHYSTPIDEIKKFIESKGHGVRNIMNIRSKITKSPMHLFFIDLEPAENNKEIYELKHINNAIIKIEPPRQVKELVQCYRCQQFGHTKAYCTKSYRCVKCGDEHPTAECQKSKEAPAKCFNCNLDHPASYRGCAVYQKIIKDKYQKTMNNIRQPQQYNNLQYPQPNLQNNNAQHTTYSDVLKDNINNSQFQKLEAMIAKQAELTNNLLNMITLLLNKLCK